MLDPKLKDYMLAAYTRLGEYGYDTVLNMINGKDYLPKQQRLLEKRIKIWLILKVLYRHVDLETTPPTLYRITEEEVNRFVRCLLNLANLTDYPIVPTLIPSVKPQSIALLGIGEQGEAGANGSDAVIDVVSIDEEEEIVVTSAILSGVKTYRVNYLKYIEQILSVVFDDEIFQQGTSNVIQVTLTSTKGRDSIITLNCNDAGTDAVLQPLVNLVSLNGVSQPQVIVLNTPAQLANKTFIFSIDDDRTLVQVTKSIVFVYPTLYGALASTGLDLYTNLTKLIEAKSDKEVLFNDEDKYFYFAYPASYGDLTAIRDEEGTNVLSAFTKTTSNISSSGLAVDWTHSYNIYRSTIKTTITNKNYNFEF